MFWYQSKYPSYLVFQLFLIIFLFHVVNNLSLWNVYQQFSTYNEFCGLYKKDIFYHIIDQYTRSL